MAFIRLYLVPSPNGTQQVIDVDKEALILSDNAFVPVQSAKTITVHSIPASFDFTPFSADQAAVHLDSATLNEVRVCWREPVGTDDFPNQNVIAAVDPTDGSCVCGITCMGTELAYAKVSNVDTTVSA
jgi:hypothetical protein